MNAKQGIVNSLIMLILTTNAVAQHTEAANPAEEPVKLKDGVVCIAGTAALASGETHRCYFVPRKVGKRDFSDFNGRAGYIISTLGADCEEMEIFGEETVTQPDKPDEMLQRVSVRCHNSDE